MFEIEMYFIVACIQGSITHKASSIPSFVYLRVTERSQRASGCVVFASFEHSHVCGTLKPLSPAPRYLFPRECSMFTLS